MIRGVQLRAPAEIKARCDAALAEAVAVCEANGIKVKPWRGTISVRPIPGEKKFRNGWAWMHKVWKTWVMAHCAGGPRDFWIKLATDPKDINKGWQDGTMIHEFCHAILIAGYGIRTHDPRLWGKVFGWQEGAVGG